MSVTRWCARLRPTALVVAVLIATIPLAPTARAGDAEPHPAHIHAGVCPAPGDIVAEVTGADAAEIDKVLGEAGGQVAIAIVALLSGVGVEEACERLARADGRVRDAIGKAGAQ